MRRFGLTSSTWKAAGVFALFVQGFVGTLPPPAIAQNCGDTIVANTTLTADLGPCPGDGLVIGADGITLDLGKHTIEGSGVGTGVLLDGRSNVKVMNGRITNFGNGVFVTNSSTNLIRGLTVDSNKSVTGVEGVGIVLWAGNGPNSNNRIEVNTVENNDRQGIFLGFSDGTIATTGNTVASNTVRNNGVRDPGNCPGGDTTPHCDQYGIQLWNASSNTVEKNKISGHNDWFFGQAIYLVGVDGAADNNRVKNNQISDNILGISLFFNTSDNLLEANRLLNNGTGLRIFSGGSTSANIVVRNIAEGGSVVASTFGEGDGLRIDAGGNTLNTNRGKNNADDGLDVRGAANVLRSNVFDSNGDWGICADASSIDAGGNRGRLNGTGDVSFAGAAGVCPP